MNLPKVSSAGVVAQSKNDSSPLKISARGEPDCSVRLELCNSPKLEISSEDNGMPISWTNSRRLFGDGCIYLCKRMYHAVHISSLAWICNRDYWLLLSWKKLKLWSCEAFGRRGGWLFLIFLTSLLLCASLVMESWNPPHFKWWETMETKSHDM